MVDPTDAHLGRRWVRRGKLLLFLLWEVILSKSVASAFSQSSTHSRFRAVPTHHHTQQQRHPLLRRINMYPKTGKNAHFRKRYGQEEQLRMARNDNELGWIERILSSSFESKRSTDFTRPVTTTQQANTIPVSLHSAPASRRVLFGSTLIGVGTALSYGTTDVACAAGSDTTTSNNMVGKDAGTTANRSKSRLQWQVTPVNKRTGVTVYDAERAGYKVNFVTYLSRFLLTFDPDCQRWWINRAADIPRTATADQVTAYRNSQFGAFSASVEVGLQEYGRPNGPETLFASLIRRYCPNDSTGTTGTAATPAASASAALSMGAGMDGTTASKLRRDREMKEARRQICLLFGLMEQNQPVDALTQQLAAIDNGSIARIQIIDRGSGYAPGYGSPDVRFPPPEAGSGYVTATGRAILSPNGKLLRIDVINRGAGYSKPPLVTISPPAAIRFSDVGTEFAEAAQAEATLFRSGPNKGRVERIQLISPGAGYTQREIIRILIRPSDTPIQKGGITATATAVLEYEVSEIVIVNNGTGYAVEKPIKIYVEPPPPTALSNMNDPLIVRSIAATESSSSSKELRNKVSDSKDPLSIPSLRVIPDNLGSSRPVVAVAYPTAVNKNIFNAFRKSDDDPLKTGMADVSEKATSPSPRRIVSATSAGDLPEPLNFVSGGSSELLSLLPAGVGLEFNALYNRYELAVDPNYQDNAPLWLKSKARKIDPDFGPRGRSPIERDMQLGVATYLRFILSGAICCSGAHLLLTPIDGKMHVCFVA